MCIYKHLASLPDTSSQIFHQWKQFTRHSFSLLGGINLSSAEASFCIVGRAGEKEKESAGGGGGDDGKEDEEPIILITKADHSFVRLR